MSKVSITRSKLDDLATAISAKSGVPLPLTIAQMQTAVQNIPTGGGTYRRTEILPEQTITPGSSRIATLTNMSMLEDGAAYIVTFDGDEWAWTCETMWNSAYTLGDINLYFGNSGDYVAPFGLGMEFQGDADIAVKDTNQHTVKIEKLEFVDDGEILTTKTITQNGTYIASDDDADGYSSVTVNVPSGSPTLQDKTVSYTPSETAQSATVTSDSGYDGLSSVAVSVGAISSTYVGSGVTRQTSKTVTPTETTQTAVASGVYTTGAVTVGAISSTYVGSGINQNDSTDLTASGATVTVPAGYYASQATKSVASGTAGTPTATKGTVSNHSVTVTPSVTNTTGYISGGTKTGTAVTVSASELVSGSETKTANGTYDVTNLAELVVNVPSGSSKAIYIYKGLASRKANSYGSTSATVTVTKAGTYTISYVAIRGSSSGTMGTNLHIGSTSGTDNTTWTGTYAQSVTLTSQTIAANTVVTIYATSGSNSRTIYVGQLIVEEE